MKLSGTQIEQIQHALLDAYDQASLRQMVRIALNEGLEQIAGGGNFACLNDNEQRKGHQ